MKCEMCIVCHLPVITEPDESRGYVIVKGITIHADCWQDHLFEEKAMEGYCNPEAREHPLDRYNRVEKTFHDLIAAREKRITRLRSEWETLLKTKWRQEPLDFGMRERIHRRLDDVSRELEGLGVHDIDGAIERAIQEAKDDEAFDQHMDRVYGPVEKESHGASRLAKSCAQ